jgi:predicted oxidoreductase
VPGTAVCIIIYWGTDKGILQIHCTLVGIVLMEGCTTMCCMHTVDRYSVQHRHCSGIRGEGEDSWIERGDHTKVAFDLQNIR